MGSNYLRLKREDALSAIETLYDEAKRAERDRIELDNVRGELHTLKTRFYTPGNLRPFMHPLGKIETIKYVRVLANMSLLDAKNMVDKWVNDGLVTVPSPFTASVVKEWENTGKAYNVGDLVTRYDMTWRCFRATRQNEVCWGPEDAYCQHWEKAGL